MKRIGIIASHIAKDDLMLYNLSVIGMSCLLSLLIFFVAAFSVVVGLALTVHAARGILAIDAGSAPFRFALMGLAAVTGLVNLTAIIVNLKLKR
jgi:hypothetical protein